MKIRCLNCNAIIESLSVHDLKKCKCGACFIDGGDKYTRVGGNLEAIVFVKEDGTEKPLSSMKIHQNKIKVNKVNYEKTL